MKKLTIHERINFKSHFLPDRFLRIKRVEHYRHLAESGNTRSFEIPYWQELQTAYVSTRSAFENKK